MTAPVIAYGCQTWSVAMGEGLSLRVFENRVLRKMFDSERVKVTRDTRGFKMCRTQGNKMKKNEMGCACGTYGETAKHTMDRDRIGLVQNRRKVRAVVNTAMYLRFRHTWRTASLPDKLAASQEGTWSSELVGYFRMYLVT